MLREQVPFHTSTLAAWLARRARQKTHCCDPECSQTATAGRGDPSWEDVVRRRDHDVDNRLAAVMLLLECKEPRPEDWLLDLVTKVEDGPVMAALLRGVRRPPANPQVLVQRLASSSGAVRAVVMNVLANQGVSEAAPHVPALLDDPDVEVAGRLRPPRASSACRIAAKSCWNWRAARMRSCAISASIP